MTKTAAIYARVSSDRQRERGTIASQTAAVREYARERGYVVPPEWVFEDDGCRGARLDRPGLEAVRDLAAAGRIEAVLVLTPDRLSRKHAYQVLLLEEFAQSGVACEFVQSPPDGTPQHDLLVQIQGVVAEYERVLHEERSRRGKRHRARAGSPSVLSGAPYGYRYIKRSREADARYEILAGQAEVVRQVFDSYTQEHCSIGGDRASADGARDSDAHRQAALGPLGHLGHAAQSGLLRSRLLRQDGHGPEAEADAALAGAGQVPEPPGERHRAAARGMDRDSGAGAGERGAIRPGAGAAGAEQAARQAADEGADAAAGHAGVPAVRLCVLPVLDAHDETEAVLLPLPGLGRLALRRGGALRESAAAAGPAGPAGVGRAGAAAGRAGPAAGRAGTAAGSRTRGGSATAPGGGTAG